MQRCLILVASTVAGTPPAWAWDDFGHMTAAAIAYDDLTPIARAKVTALLALHPE